MRSIWNTNLTDSEIERYAYIYGKRHLASYAAQAEDQEDLEDLEGRYEEKLENACEESFEKGKAVGIGLDTNKVITKLQQQIADLKSSHQRCRDNLQAVHQWLLGNDCKTAKGRKDYALRVNDALGCLPRY